MAEPKDKKEILDLPSNKHPLYDHYTNSKFWRAGLIARKSLQRHVRSPDYGVTKHIATTFAGLDMRAFSNDKSWKDLLETLDKKDILHHLLNATQHWMVVAFDSQDGYASFVEQFTKLFEMQLASNSLLPEEYTSEFNAEEFKSLVSSNPIIAFLIAVFLGGPLSESECDAITLQVPNTTN